MAGEWAWPGVCMARGCAWPGGMCGLGVCMVGACMPRGVHGGMHGQGGMCAWGACKPGGRCALRGMHSRKNGHCSGQCASYWNAFLFEKCDQWWI